MKITVIGVGSLKEKYLKDAISEYKKRITRFSDIEIVEIPDESNSKDEKTVKKLEGERILKKISDSSYAIFCDLKGKMLDSVELANKITDICSYNSSHITFVIGGSLGFSEEALKRADFKICFSKMTFPHQLMRVILLEQIYRAFKINNNESYHK